MRANARHHHRHRHQLRRRWIVLAGVLACLGIADVAAADDVGAAARAFNDAQAAQLAGDYDHAAQSFELAFSIAPSAEALRSAVRARKAAGQLPRAATLAELLRTEYGDDAPSVELADEVLGEARRQLTRIEIRCDAACTIAIDRRAADLGSANAHVIYAAPGNVRVVADFGDNRTAGSPATLVAGKPTVLAFEAPPMVARPARTAAADDQRDEPGASRGGLSRAVPIAMAVLTVAVAGVGVWSGLDTNKAHDAYVENPTHEAFEDGRSKQLRTNILFGGAAALGIGTILVAALWTDWHGGGKADEPAPVSFAPVAGGATVSVGGAF